MAKRVVEFTVVMELARASKEAHAVTINKVARQVGAHAVELMDDRGYTVERAEVTNLMHYVRHAIRTTLVGGRRVRHLKKVV